MSDARPPSWSREGVGIVMLALVGVAVAWTMRFGLDDAYISFVFARSLVRGEGLTWFGTRVEGYTNFLWVLWSALGLKLGFDPLRWAWLGSLSALGAAVVTTFAVARLRTKRVLVGFSAAAMLVTNYSFLAFGTSGLETMLQTALLAVAWWQTERCLREEPSVRLLAGLSTVMALALMTRLDSAVVGLVLGLAVVRRLVTARAPARVWLAAVGPSLGSLSGWLGWKLVYYGDVLPNTFHAKAEASLDSVAIGALVLGRFLHAYGLWAFFGLAMLVGARHLRRVVLPLTMSLAWFGYVVLVGGDFMEFRFFVPVLPALFVTLAELVTLEGGRVRAELRAASAVVGLAGLSMVHAETARPSPDHTTDSIRQMAGLYGHLKGGDWGRLGRPLHQVLAGTGATIACNGAGAIPYYADLPAVDQLGLVDPWVARHGVRPGPEYRRPGHQRFAPLRYLLDRRVTFVIGNAQEVPRGFLRTPEAAELAAGWLPNALGPASAGVFATTLNLVAVPVDAQNDLVLWYLTPEPAVTARIRAAGWDVVQFKAGG